MTQSVDPLPPMRPITGEFEDPALEAEYRRHEIDQVGPYAAVSIGALVVLVFLFIGVWMDVGSFVGNNHLYLPWMAAYRIVAVGAMLTILWWAKNGLRPETFERRMLLLHAVVATFYCGLAFIYGTVAGWTQSDFWYTALPMITIIGTSGPVRWAVLTALPYFASATILHAVLLDSGPARLGRLLAFMTAGCLLAVGLAIRLTRGRRVEFAYRMNLRRINARLQQEVAARTAAEAQLRRHQEHLEELVEARTSDLHASEERLRSLTENLGDLIARIDPELKIVYHNRAVEPSAGFPARELIGKRLDAMAEVGVPREIVDDLIGHVRAVFESGSPRAFNFEVEGDVDGERRQPFAFDQRIFPEKGPDGRVTSVVISSRDMSELRTAERRESDLRAQLQQSQKLEALGRLAGGVAHDFNNLLVPILNCADMIRGDQRASDDSRQKAETIFAASLRARDLTSQLLAFGRSQPLDVRPLDMHELLNRARGMWSRLLPSSLEMEVRLEAERHYVRGDPSQLELALMNVALNAMDAMPGGGRLSIRTANSPAEVPDGEAGSPASPPASVQLLIEVVDTGQGIEPSLLERIFEPFFTTKEMGKGTGLGLAMVYGTVQQHGGAIEVDSAPGSGTRFTIRLPTIEPEVPARVAADGAKRRSKMTGTVTVLLVEDNEMVREMTEQMLDLEGFRVLKARSGEEALRLADEHPEAIDLLLSDMVMPGMNGKQLWERLRGKRENLRVIFTSGYTDGLFDPSDRAEELVAYLRKPFTIDQLTAKMQEALAGTPAPAER